MGSKAQPSESVVDRPLGPRHRAGAATSSSAGHAPEAAAFDTRVRCLQSISCFRFAFVYFIFCLLLVATSLHPPIYTHSSQPTPPHAPRRHRQSLPPRRRPHRQQPAQWPHPERGAQEGPHELGLHGPRRVEEPEAQRAQGGEGDDEEGRALFVLGWCRVVESKSGRVPWINRSIVDTCLR